jgi:hypothetical protein
MRKSAKTIKRLGLVAGAGTVAGLMPIAGLSAAYATQPAGPPTLALSSTVPGATATATNTFTTTGAIAAAGTITINSLSTSGPSTGANAETLPAYVAAVAGPPAVPSNYVVTVGGTNDPVTGVAGGAGDTETITLTNAVAAGTPVTVTIAGVVNATAASTVYFSDLTSGDTTAANTNTVNVTAATPAASAVATVSSVNPTAVPTGTATDFTLTGSNFYGTAGSATVPDVYFIPAGTAAPATPALAALTPGAGAATVTSVTTTQLQGTSPTTFAAPAPTSNTSYNVVVYNVGVPTTTSGFEAPSATSASTALYESPNLNFVPENGVRVADSRVGLSLPNGAIASGTTVGFPVTALENSATMPSNIPAGADAVALNVTAIAPASGGNLQVTNSGTCATTTSTTPEIGTAAVNFQPGQDTSNTIVVPTTAAFLCIRDVGAPVQVTLDATGYINNGSFTSADAPLLDTRPSRQFGSLLGPLAGGQVYSVGTGLVAGTEVALEVTAVAPTAPGNLRVFPEPASGPPAASGVPDTAAVNYVPGTDSGSYFLTTVGASGNIDIYSDSTGTVNVVLGDAGTFTGSSLVASTAPYRILDTRPTGIASGSSVTVTGSPSGSGSVFTPGDAVGVFGQLSDINPSAQGYETVYPAGAAVPNTASIANYPGQVRENTAFAPLNSSGQFSIASVGGTTNSTFDVSGYIS